MGTLIKEWKMVLEIVHILQRNENRLKKSTLILPLYTTQRGYCQGPDYLLQYLVIVLLREG